MKYFQFLLIIIFTSIVTFTVKAQKKIFKAIETGNISDIEKYISKGGDLNVTDKQTSIDYDGNKIIYAMNLLEWAAVFEQKDIIYLLIKHKNKFSNFDLYINKAFAISISSGNEEIIKNLLDQGADINYKCTSCYDQPALQIALNYDYFNLFDFFISKGADISINSSNGRTLLHTVGTTGNIRIAKYLIEQGLDINARDNDGATPIYFATGNANFKMFKLFWDKGTDPRIKPNDGETILMEAAAGGDTIIINFLLENDFPELIIGESMRSSVNNVDNENDTPLMYAVYNDNIEAASLLIAKGADVSHVNEIWETPLLWAIWNQNTEMCKLLIENNANLEEFDYLKRAKKNIKNKAFLEYLEKKIDNW